jgi:hypothetical protein
MLILSAAVCSVVTVCFAGGTKALCLMCSDSAFTGGTKVFVPSVLSWLANLLYVGVCAHDGSRLSGSSLLPDAWGWSQLPYHHS